MTRAARLVAVITLAACASRPQYEPPAGSTVYGSYPFRSVASQATPPIAIEGVVILLPDTVVLTLKDGKCTYAPDRRSSQYAFNYYCGDFSFALSRDNPLRQNLYRVSYAVWVQQRYCITTRPNPQTGYETCTRYGTERVQQQRVASGRLDFVERK